ncbi:MAG: DUF6636 domain-containing protein [Gammaproteobacteria bacterium]|nr:DUF6636 domain-containing protein [Gammaproteobacteria bacterium]
MSVANAHGEPNGFRTPSSNIFCQLYSEASSISLRCDIMDLDKRSIPPKPRDCEFDWGQGFEIDNKQMNGYRICISDSVMDESLPILGYSETWQLKGFTCKLERSGLTCFNEFRHGFIISRKHQKLF